MSKVRTIFDVCKFFFTFAGNIFDMDEKEVNEAIPESMTEEITDTIRRHYKNVNSICEDLERLKERMICMLLRAELDLKKAKNKKQGKLFAFLKRSFG